MEETSARGLLGEFLRAHRERLTPEEAGLPSYGRRRTPGLRREEVAQLAHIGTSWYTSLEQGRDVNPSAEVLDSLAAALRLNEEERRYLHRLAKPDEPPRENLPAEKSAGLARAVFALDPNPALLMARDWDLLRWNRAAERVFRLPAFAPGMSGRPNWLRRFLADPTVRRINPDWEDKARILIARFRADFARYPNDVRFRELVEEFTRTSELFRLAWPRHAVEAAVDCHKRWRDPEIGEMEFEQVTLQPPDRPDLKLVIYSASPDTAEGIERAIGPRRFLENSGE
ncbi:helix-turn-helix transcriptional regulator [Cohnella zeiphila]|uniref:Helix-turn-helix domain-containing protein n=1 Tax=Cohnella zeiphila TaxID=2761120 RepID=A0A7X0SNF5_9BACL|nr:helix-turn-helix transcriptional regulator [Cohnella zeiphila]MBB6733228.1 helix-turn-helix domain-containing protein [Cohnella zeiphila]